VQPGGAHRGARLGTAGDQIGAGQHGAQRVTEAPAVRRLQPAAHADPGVDQHHVRRGAQAGAGGGPQLGVVGDRHDAQRGGQHHPGAAALQQAGQLVPAPVRGHSDGVTGQRRGRLGERRRGDHGPACAPRAVRHPPRFPAGCRSDRLVVDRACGLLVAGCLLAGCLLDGRLASRLLAGC
jgi:hypothetical protein